MSPSQTSSDRIEKQVRLSASRFDGTRTQSRWTHMDGQPSWRTSSGISPADHFDPDHIDHSPHIGRSRYDCAL